MVSLLPLDTVYEMLFVGVAAEDCCKGANVQPIVCTENLHSQHI
jgi:hypothetical protein